MAKVRLASSPKGKPPKMPIRIKGHPSMTADQPVPTIVNGSASVPFLSLKKTNAYPFMGRGGSEGAERKIPKVGTTQKDSQITAEKQIVMTNLLTIKKRKGPEKLGLLDCNELYRI
jgi:hypothetical protein